MLTAHDFALGNHHRDGSALGLQRHGGGGLQIGFYTHGPVTVAIQVRGTHSGQLTPCFGRRYQPIDQPDFQRHAREVAFSRFEPVGKVDDRRVQ